MPEIINNKKVFTLLEVTHSIQKTLQGRYSSSFWVRAEMNKLNYYSHSGHCYPDLVQKHEGKVIAQLRANLWKNEYQIINNNFIKVLKEPIKDGIKILFLAEISFAPVHGLALRILDIDPAYTLGDLEKEKQETTERLRKEGLLEKNKKLPAPLLPQRIAIISVETSKGYADFLKVLESNPWNYRFFHMLFPSLLQGEKAVTSICGQLKRIEKVKQHFDMVAIIRGGGGDVGLSCYNNYRLASEVAKFPLPVITGIGHATNETVVESVAFSNAITPTKIAEYLIQKFHDFAYPVQRAEEKIEDRSLRLLKDERSKFNTEAKLFFAVTENVLKDNRNEVKSFASVLSRQSMFLFKHQRDKLRSSLETLGKESRQCLDAGKQEIDRFAIFIRKDTLSFISRVTTELNSLEKNLENMSPESVLKRGYSLTLKDGKAVKSIKDVMPGESLETLVFDGSIETTVKRVKKTGKHE